ncbi:hypothetical protein D3C86_1894380 [compost metagenome]
MTGHQVRRQLVTHLRADRNQLRRAFHQPQEVPVARVPRVRQQPVLARVHQQGTGQQQRARAAGGDENALRIDIQPVTLPIEA